MSGSPLRALFVEPFFGGSHRAFAEGWIGSSAHAWTLVSLPADSWKWRMRLGAWTLGREVSSLAQPPEVVVATGLLDLAHLRLASGLSRGVPFLLYLHENQFSYPRPRGKPLDRSFAVAHVSSLLAADAVAINSRAHRSAMAEELRKFLGRVPRPHPPGLVRRVARARVLYPGVDLARFPEPGARPASRPPVIVWNHRWEEDKRPSAFARIMIALADSGAKFRLVLLGEGDQVQPTPLLMLRERLSDRILRDTPARSREEYVQWLARADVAVSTSAQENFGYAVIEAMAAGAVPLLPRRLSYPEILPDGLGRELLYDTDAGLRQRLESWLSEPSRIEALRAPTMRASRSHEWSHRTAALDDWVSATASRDAGRNG